MTNIKLHSKSEWFEFDSPLAEPHIKWKDSSYVIERTQDKYGKIVWFGQSTNWVKNPGESWTYLGDDETVKPTLHIKGENGMGDYCEYPEERLIWIPCDPPIYEKLYEDNIHNTK